MGKIMYTENNPRYREIVSEIEDVEKFEVEEILKQCTEENFQGFLETPDDIENDNIRGVHYVLPSGLHVYGCIENHNIRNISNLFITANKLKEPLETSAVFYGDEGKVPEQACLRAKFQGAESDILPIKYTMMHRDDRRLIFASSSVGNGKISTQLYTTPFFSSKHIWTEEKNDIGEQSRGGIYEVVKLIGRTNNFSQYEDSQRKLLIDSFVQLDKKLELTLSQKRNVPPKKKENIAKNIMKRYMRDLRGREKLVFAVEEDVLAKTTRYLQLKDREYEVEGKKYIVKCEVCVEKEKEEPGKKLGFDWARFWIIDDSENTIAFCRWDESTLYRAIDRRADSCIRCEMYDIDKYYKVVNINPYDSFGIKYLTRSKPSRDSYSSEPYVYKIDEDEFPEYVKDMISPEMIQGAIETIEDRVSYRTVPSTGNKDQKSRWCAECSEISMENERTTNSDFEQEIGIDKIAKRLQEQGDIGKGLGKEDEKGKSIR